MITDLDHALAYGIFRLTLGINILIHGAIRLAAGAQKFASSTSSQFTNTPLPGPLVHLFLAVLPFAEASLGALLVIGLWTRWTLVLGSLLMTALVFGTCLRGDWNTAGLQMIYVIAYYLLLANRHHNRFSVDSLIHARR